ncbi:MAG: sulfatase [Phycisphaerales bacterium]|nr:MAG: sulfatase [Phycisphaerales bacterium]
MHIPRCTALAVLLFGLVTGVADPAPCETRPRPNILMIVSEDNGPELGCYGDPYARTPHLDQLAANGVRFNRAFVTQAGCSQSRASILTGLYPHQHGQIGLATWGFRMYRPDTPNLVRSLKEVGYRTGIIGKLHINPAAAFPFDMHEIPTSNFARENLGDYTRYAEAFINAGDRPFLLSVNYPDAHAPWIKQIDGLPRQPLDADDVKALPYFGIDTPGLRKLNADYYNCLSRLDSLIGDLMETLERSGKADNTLVVYLGDHGADFLRGKRTSYEGGVRIPLIIRWPGRAKPQQVRQELVSTVDLMPTLLEAAGARAVENLPGRSLLPLLFDKPVEWRRYLFTEYHTHAAEQNFYPQRTVRNQRYKLIENLMPGQVNPGYAFTNSRFPNAGVPDAIVAATPVVSEAYRLMRRPSRFELYDLQVDPHEFRNLADVEEHASTLAQLQQQLATWRRQTKDPLLDPENLRRLAHEVQGLTKKQAKKYKWGYPDYFFGEPPRSRPAIQSEAGTSAKKKTK